MTSAAMRVGVPQTSDGVACRHHYALQYVPSQLYEPKSRQHKPLRPFGCEYFIFNLAFPQLMGCLTNKQCMVISTNVVAISHQKKDVFV